MGRAILGIATLLAGLLGGTALLVALLLVAVGYSPGGFWDLITVALAGPFLFFAWAAFSQYQLTATRYVFCDQGLLLWHPRREPEFVRWNAVEQLRVRNVATCFEVVTSGGTRHLRVPFDAVRDPNRPGNVAELRSLLLHLTRHRPSKSRRVFRASIWDVRVLALAVLATTGLLLLLALAQAPVSAAMWAAGIAAAGWTLYHLAFYNRITVGSTGIALTSPLRRREIPYSELQSVEIAPYDRWQAIFVRASGARIRLPWDSLGLIELYDAILTEWEHSSTAEEAESDPS